MESTNALSSINCSSLPKVCPKLGCVWNCNFVYPASFSARALFRPVSGGISLSWPPWLMKMGVLRCCTASSTPAGSHPEKAQMPARGCSYISPAAKANTAPWLKPTSTIRSAGIPRASAFLIISCTTATDSNRPSWSSAGATGVRSMSNQRRSLLPPK